jgi:hypothetical protein
MSFAPRAGHKGHAQRFRDPTTKSRITPRFGSAQAMVEVEDLQRASPPGPVRPEQQQQRERIRAAGKRDRPPRAP